MLIGLKVDDGGGEGEIRDVLCCVGGQRNGEERRSRQQLKERRDKFGDAWLRTKAWLLM